MESNQTNSPSLELTKMHIARKKKLNSMCNKASNSSQNVNSGRIYHELKKKYVKEKAKKSWNRRKFIKMLKKAANCDFFVLWNQ